MSSDYKTPKRHTSSKAVDLITGKEKVEYFFDPALLIPEQTPRTPKRNDSSQSLSILSHKHLFSPCTIVKKDESHTLTKTSDGTLYKLASDEMTQLTAEDRQGLEDVLHLPNISEPSLLHTLRVRYHRDEIYTNAGPILISINPYKTIMKQNSSIYSDSVMAAYRKNRCSAPHLFTIADRAYNALLTKNKNQSIIISGESGAGKTEATKIIMQYLAKTSHTRNTSQLEQQVLSSSPLLESFGNARTLRNDNSSRFGKFIQIKFQNGHISGATIRNYLLEKTRIVQQIEGERNYHIFYQILSDQILSEELGLHDAEGLNFLSKKYVKSKRDEKGLEETRECLKNIGLDDDDVKVIFQVVAGVLHLGNVSFIVAGENEKVSIADGESQRSLEMGCKMLGMDANEVSKAILTKVLNVGGKTITQDQNVAQATDKRDALAKLVYSSLFLWLVSRINATIDRVHSPDDILSPSSTFSFDFNDSDGLSSIGVLDIYGFEQFDVNGFEQLLINYANEKLQRHFNKHLFEVEQELYSHEGVDWTYITFNDNKACLDLIEGGSGSVGILGTLDDAWSGMGSGNEKDVKFVSQLHQFFGGVQETSASVKKIKGKSEGRHDNFRMPKFANDKDFIVIHYAGEVRYTAHGFVEKNVESLSNEMKSLGMTSSSELCRDIFTYFSDEISNVDNSSSNRTRSTIRGVSIASQFKASLQNLVGDLEETEPHYVRCIKPNLKKTSNDFGAGEVLRQLRYAGMLEAIRIRREGYALREPHESFYNKFHILFDSADLKEGEGIEHLVKVLSKRLSVTSIDWQIGHSKIFLRRELAAKLNALMSLRIRSAARTLGRFGRHVAHRSAGSFIISWARFRLHMRQKYKALRASIKIQSLYRQWNQRKTYEICIQAIITIQSNIRMALAMKALKRLIDPYRDMTYIEVRELYRAEEQCLEYAVATKDYELAAEIEKNMIPLKEALEKKRPLSRALIEKMINDIEAELKEALAKKRYNDCPPLQQKLDELHEKRKYYPTVDELRQMVSQAEQAVDEAAAKRDFTGAAERQINVEKAKRRLAEAIAAEKESDEELSIPIQPELNMFSNRVELEEKIREIKADIEKAIQSKKFNVASSLQEELNDLEARRADFPTVLELEQRCRSKESEMAEAIAKKEYSRAASLQEDIDSLQEWIKREKSVRENQLTENNDFSSTDNCVSATLPNGVILQFYCRTELDFAISEYVAKVDESAMHKNFTDAKQNQDIVNQLEILRPLLPTMQDLEEAEKKLSSDLQNAIKAKDYVKAENLQIQIQDVKNKITLESNTNNSLNSKITNVNGTKETAKKPIAKLSQHNTNMIDKHNETKRDYKTVLRLRPKKPLVSNVQDSVLTVAQMLANKRSSASIVIGADGNLAGIITDTDITRRLVARDLNASKTNVTKIMTSNPTVVSVDDPAMEALGIMVENHFRHLPVVDDRGSVVGVLDIAKCLNDAISKLERAEEQKNSAAEDAVKQMAAMQGAGGQQAAMLTQLLAPLMAQAFGNKASPTLRSLLAGKPATIVSPDTSLKETATVMSEARKAALVVEDGKLVGIFGFKDMMSRAVAKELPLEHTEVREVMTPDPESVSPDITVIEALQIMHENKFLNLPVCEKDGTVCGLVGVMDLIYGCGGAEGWRSLFDVAFEFDQDRSKGDAVPTNFSETSPSFLATKSPFIISNPDNIPNHVEFKDDDQDSMGDSLLDRTLSYPIHSPDRTSAVFGEISFKLTDSKGHRYLIRSDGKLDNLLKAIFQKVGGEINDVHNVRLKFIDAEGDEINITSDECLSEAIMLSRKNGDQGVKLILSIIPKDGGSGTSPKVFVTIGGVIALLVLGIATMTLHRRSK